MIARALSGCYYERIALVSADEDVLSLRLNSSCAFDLSVHLSRTDAKKKAAAEAEGGGAAEQGTVTRVRSSSLEMVGAASEGGVAFAARLSAHGVTYTGGAAAAEAADDGGGGGLSLRGVREATLLLAAATDFHARAGVGEAGDGEAGARAGGAGAARLMRECTERASAAAAVPWAELYARHVRAHRDSMRGVRLRIGSDSAASAARRARMAALPTDARLRKSRAAAKGGEGGEGAPRSRFT